MKKEMPSREMCIAYDITDPTPYEEWADEEEVEEKPHEILDGKLCPICEKPMMSNEHISCCSLPNDWAHVYDVILHSKCLKDDAQEFIEKAQKCSITEELGEAME